MGQYKDPYGMSQGFSKNAVRDSMTKLDSFPVASLIQESHHSLLSLDVPEILNFK